MRETVSVLALDWKENNWDVSFMHLYSTESACLHNTRPEAGRVVSWKYVFFLSNQYFSFVGGKSGFMTFYNIYKLGIFIKAVAKLKSMQQLKVLYCLGRSV